MDNYILSDIYTDLWEYKKVENHNTAILCKIMAILGPKLSDHLDKLLSKLTR